MSNVAQHQADPAVVPIVGAPLSSATVRAVINALTDAYNLHDADSTIHVVSGLAANRPAASALANSIYFATDTLSGSYSNGSAWSAWNYTNANPVPNQSDMLFLASTRR